MIEEIEKTALELAFEKFNNLMEQYNIEFTSTDDPEKQNEIQEKYDSLIEAEEKELENAVNLDFEEEKAAAEKTELEFTESLKFDPNEPKIEEEEEEISPVSMEIKFLKDNSFTADKIADRYLKTKINETGFSTSDIYKHLGGTGNPTEAKMAEFIFQEINKI